MLAAPLIMRLLTVGVVVYAVGAVASALLNAGRRFAAVSFAPVANNVVVTVTMVVFIVQDWGSGLRLTMPAKLLLAVGTTAGVVAMAAVPLVAASRAGFRLRPQAVRLTDP